MGWQFFYYRFGRNTSAYAQKRPGEWMEPPTVAIISLPDPGRAVSNPPLPVLDVFNLSLIPFCFIYLTLCFIYIFYVSIAKITYLTFVTFCTLGRSGFLGQGV